MSNVKICPMGLFPFRSFCFRVGRPFRYLNQRNTYARLFSVAASYESMMWTRVDIVLSSTIKLTMHGMISLPRHFVWSARVLHMMRTKPPLVDCTLYSSQVDSFSWYTHEIKRSIVLMANAFTHWLSKNCMCVKTWKKSAWSTFNWEMSNERLTRIATRTDILLHVDSKWNEWCCLSTHGHCPFNQLRRTFDDLFSFLFIRSCSLYFKRVVGLSSRWITSAIE